jgi:hypothetical protein
MFAPCPNITAAARLISKFAERCKATSNANPIYCAIAAYRGSWDRPDAGFADAVRITVEKGNAPNFDMPKDAYFDSNDITFETVTPRTHPALTAPEMTSDDRERGWSSALFSAKPAKPESTSADAPSPDRPAREERSPGRASATPGTSKTPADSLFVPRSSERRP